MAQQAKHMYQCCGSESGRARNFRPDPDKSFQIRSCPDPDPNQILNKNYSGKLAIFTISRQNAQFGNVKNMLFSSKNSPTNKFKYILQNVISRRYMRNKVQDYLCKKILGNIYAGSEIIWECGSGIRKNHFEKNHFESTTMICRWFLLP